MRRYRFTLSLLVLASIVFALLPAAAPIKAQDLVATEELGGGSSVFVFRESRKKSQSRAGGGRVSLAAAGRVGGGLRLARGNAQIAVIAQKRRAAALQAHKRAAITAANRKIALSNMLAAKADAFLESNQTDLAISNYRDALVQNSKNQRAIDGLTNALTAKGIEVAGETNASPATAYFEEAIKIDPKNDVAYAKLGAIYDASGQIAQAIANYEKALAINPEYSTLLAPLGMAYLDAGEIAKAEASLAKAVAAGSETPESRVAYGIIFLRQNKNPEALAAFDRVIAVDANNAAAHYYRGQILDRMNQSDNALAAYKRSLEADPTFAPASFEMGVTYYNKGDYNNAVTAYQLTIQYEPNNYQAHANLASTYRQLERFPEANAEYKIASQGINTPDLYSEWGYCLGKTKEWDKSVERLNTAKEMSPTAIDNSNLGWGYYNKATAEKEAKKEDEANKDLAQAKVSLETAVQQDPKLDAAYLNLGSTHNALGEFQAAVNVLRTVLGFRPDWVLANNQLGVGYRGLNDLVNAVAVFKRVVDLDGNNVFGLFNLGEAYHASGNKKEAKKISDRLKKLDPTAASRLDNIFSGKAVIDAAQQKIKQAVPKIPRFPKFP